MAVLRAFEKEMGVEVIRPDIAGLMGAHRLCPVLRQEPSGPQDCFAMMNERVSRTGTEGGQRRGGGCGKPLPAHVNTLRMVARHISGNRPATSP